ncbi:MAG TPA: nitrilase-related carbon-nitrogen hydrolase, partial [Thermomicrobiales bacterium]|nr:nitrilase-related carbon-nitrogen hydrolase [Thermomicrobiales bacterium]
EYRESDDFCHGDHLQTVQVGGLTLGLSICYDLRFAELFRSLRAQGANALVVPAAFNVHTGRDHWEVLLRARAIENQSYVLAAAQIGGPGPAMPCLGRSMIIDPWGTVLATAPDGVGMALADLDFAHLRRIRAELPSLANRRPEAYPAAERVAVPVAD